MTGILALLSILVGVDPVYSVSRGDASVPTFQVMRGEFSPSPRAGAGEVEKQEIEILTPKWKCSHCDDAKSDIGKWKSNPYKITFREVEDAESPDGFPRVRWVVRGVKWGYVGWYGTSVLDSEFKRSHNEKTKAKSKSVSKTRRYSSGELRSLIQSYRGPDVGVRGMTVWDHLQDGNHGFSSGQLAGLNQWELMRLHGAHHNGSIFPFTSVDN